MEPQTPREAQKSLKDQVSNTSELIRSLKSPKTPRNNISLDFSRVSDSLPDTSISSPLVPTNIASPILEQKGPETQIERRNNLQVNAQRRMSHRMSMYSINGELTYQRDAEKQLMASISAAKRELRGDFLIVLLERVVTQAISLYNTAPQGTVEDVDSLCVSLSDYIRRYTDQTLMQIEQVHSDHLNAAAPAVDPNRSSDMNLLHSLGVSTSIRDFQPSSLEPVLESNKVNIRSNQYYGDEQDDRQGDGLFRTSPVTQTNSRLSRGESWKDSAVDSRNLSGSSLNSRSSNQLRSPARPKSRMQEVIEKLRSRK